MPEQVDVLICGSGSAGLCAAVWLTRYGVDYKLLERRPGPLDAGQADGVQTRTVEIFESLGLGPELLREAAHVLEVAFYNADPNGNGIRRSRFAADTAPGLSHLPHVILNQARVHALLETQTRSGSIEYGCDVRSVEVLGSGTGLARDDYCVRVLSSKGKETVEYRAKYVLACDGAHSTVRKSLGFKMVGDTHDAVWGVIDLVPRTNYPDIRKKSIVQSTNGIIFIIPREGGMKVRFYIEQPAGTAAQDVTLETLLSLSQRIMHPFTLEAAEVTWWSAYAIGQRLANSFHKEHRIFLTGDACHTHSPKAGQGMNVSLQDGYNIGWKLGQVLSGQASPALLATYVSERQQIAIELIDFDRRWTNLLSSEYRKKNNVSPEQVTDFFIDIGRYTAGQATRYGPSSIVSADDEGELATGITVGMRFPSAQLVRFADARTVQILAMLTSSCRWRIIVFVGDIHLPDVRARCANFSVGLESVIQKFKPDNADPDSVIEALLVTATKRCEIEMDWIPDVPVTGKLKIKRLGSVFVDDDSYDSSHGHAFEHYGIKDGREVAVIVRPDQYVARIAPAEDIQGVHDFFKGFMGETS